MPTLRCTQTQSRNLQILSRSGRSNPTLPFAQGFGTITLAANLSQSNADTRLRSVPPDHEQTEVQILAC